MGDDEVEVFIVLAEFAGVQLGGHLLVEAVPDDTFARRVEVEHGVATDFCVLGTLVHNAWVGDVCAIEANLTGNGIADECAEVAGMLALNTGVAFLLHQFVHVVAAALAGASEATAAHDDGNIVGAHAMALHHVEDFVLTIVELVGHFVELLDFFDGM